MVPKYIIILLLFWCLGPAGPLAAMSLEDCLTEALQGNPTIQQAQARYDAALAQYRASSASRLPVFNTRFSYVRLSDVDPFEIQTPMGTITVSEPILDSYQAMLLAQQPLFTGFRLANQVELGRKGAGLSQIGLEISRWHLRFEVIKAYYDLIKARASHAVIAERLKALQAHLQDVRNFVEAGMATRNDLLHTEVLVSTTAIRLNQAESGTDLAELLLKALMNRQDQFPLEIDETVSVTIETLPDLDSLLELAGRSRLELRQYAVQVDMAHNLVAISRSNFYPTVMATGSYSYAQPNSRYQPLQEEFNSDWSLGFVLSFVPFDWGKTAALVRQSKAEQRELEAKIEQMQTLVRTQVSQSYRKVLETMKHVELVRIAVNHARENMRVAHDYYKEGLNRNTDVLDAETMLLQANLEQTQAEIDYIVSKSFLVKAVGTDPF